MIRSTESLHEFLHAVYVPSRLELSAASIVQIEVAIRLLERWAGRPLSVHDFSEDILRRFLTDYRRDHAAASTNSKRCHLLGLWACAYAEGVLDRPPRHNKVPRAKARPGIPAAWTLAQVAAILESSQKDRLPIGRLPAGAWWRALILVLFDTGARLGEALAVESRDLSPSERWVVFRTTKNGRQRWGALHTDTAKACQAIYDPARPLVWPMHFTRIALDRRFKQVLKRAGIQPTPGRLFRLFRITSGSLIESMGGDGAKHLGNGRAVFLKHYCDPRMMSNQLDLLPRPK